MKDIQSASDIDGVTVRDIFHQRDGTVLVFVSEGVINGLIIACLAIGLDLDNSIFFGHFTVPRRCITCFKVKRRMITGFGVLFFNVIVDVSISLGIITDRGFNSFAV